MTETQSFIQIKPVHIRKLHISILFGKKICNSISTPQDCNNRNLLIPSHRLIPNILIRSMIAGISIMDPSRQSDSQTIERIPASQAKTKALQIANNSPLRTYLQGSLLEQPFKQFPLGSWIMQLNPTVPDKCLKLGESNHMPNRFCFREITEAMKNCFSRAIV
ncbi:hypothetical protein PIB30_035657 [Stylosanthes scabra]|uniref:Uncharacterized protein n=1 Tax=Stylosanthes scabra TaxID=79078 RepID=A0ABU6RDR5_9FABA|nr:hypothetical protein [Stylosanthes scabra]